MTTIDLHEEYRLMNGFCDEAERLMNEPDDVLYKTDLEQSGWSPAQHLQHTFIASGMMLKAAAAICQGSDKVRSEGELSRIGRIVMESGRMPRGKAQAPSYTHPPNDLSRDDLKKSLARCRSKFADMEALLDEMPNVKGYLEHPVFGPMTASQWVCLVRIHADHHLSIIRDVIG